MTLRRRTLGRTGLEVSELALGTWGLTGQATGAVTSEEADRTLARAPELGVSLVETSDLYAGPGDETMESRVGRVLGSVSEVALVTRGGNDTAASPPRKRFDRIFLHRSAARSAERLRRAPDVYLLHHPTVDTLHRGEATGALTELVTEGVIAQWGVACGDEKVAVAALDVGAPVIEVPYNILYVEAFEAIAERAREQQVGILARSTLAYGLLCGTWGTDRTFPEGDHRRDRWTQEELTARLRQVAALRPLVRDDVHTLRSAALRFVLDDPRVSTAVVGVRTVAQLEANVRSIGSGPPYLPADVRARVPALLRG